jgi:hypothetical protein
MNTSTVSLPDIMPTTAALSAHDRWDHIAARLGTRRMSHKITPGLYALGNPTPNSPVFVTANYTLSFDALRSALKGIDAYIMVLNTKAINVWCAAGKGAFGTFELTRRIEQTRLSEVIRHRKLILPQLSATGVSAHKVKKQSGFTVEYGPVRAEDLPEYLKTHQATPQMRQVRFNLKDRLTLVPVEIVSLLLPMLAAAVVFFFLSGWSWALGVIAAFLAGTALFPAFLFCLPTKDFSSKGYFLGFFVALPFAIIHFARSVGPWWIRLLGSLPLLLILPAVTSFIALNFTGASTFTSPTGTRQEIFKYIPVMAWLFGSGIVLFIFVTIMRFFGGWHV